MKIKITILALALAICGGLLISNSKPISADRVGPSASSIQGNRNVLRGYGLFRSNSLETAQQNTQTARNLIAQRSGLEISPEAQTIVNQAEARFASSGKGTITVTDLTNSLTKIAVDRLSKMSDAEIDQALNSMRGIRTENRPDGAMPPGEIMIRPWGPVVKIDKARTYLQKSRSAAEAGFFTDFAKLAISNEVEDRVKLFQSADPTNWSSDRITPSQALVLTYSVLSGDLMTQTEEQMGQQMTRLQTYMDKKGYKVSLKGAHPYGVNGILYDSPLYLLDNSSIESLMTSFK